MGTDTPPGVPLRQAAAARSITFRAALRAVSPIRPSTPFAKRWRRCRSSASIGRERNILASETADALPLYTQACCIPSSLTGRSGKTAPRLSGRLPRHHALHAFPQLRKPTSDSNAPSTASACRCFAFHSGRLHDSHPLRPRHQFGSTLPIPSLLAMTCRAQPSDMHSEGTRTQVEPSSSNPAIPREVMHSCAADRLRRERHQTLIRHRDARRSIASRLSARRRHLR